MRNMIQTKLYTREEEADIFRIIRAGEKAAADLESGELTEKEKEYLLRRIEEGKRIRNDFFVNNIPLCKYVVKNYFSNYLLDRPDEYDDLVSEAIFGLNGAIDRFDVSFDTKFSTYAFHWIIQTTQRYIYQNSCWLHLPVHAGENLFRIKKYIAEHTSKGKKIPTKAEILRDSNMSKKGFDNVFWLMDSPVELDRIERDDVPSVPSETPDYSFLLINQIFSVLQETLSPVEIFVLQEYYGFNNDPKTLEKIGMQMGVTCERVRRIKENSLNKLKKACIKKSLFQPFVEYLRGDL
ncbi:MAG: sigma-70 family RNA polymerase sigma factor [Anaerolineaceae bacterium]|nr:sigma-70 family RNA polymerase sigma factor [Anaerolineaceae bacterium]